MSGFFSQVKARKLGIQISHDYSMGPPDHWGDLRGVGGLDRHPTVPEESTHVRVCE